MNVSGEKVGDVTVVVLRGDHLDAGNSDEFKRDTLPLIEGSSRVLLDMEGLEFVDSAGLGAILGCLRRLSAAGGDLKLCSMSRSVRSVFDIARMHRIFDIFDTREEALKAFQR